MEIGNYVRFKDNPQAMGVIFEVSDAKPKVHAMHIPTLVPLLAVPSFQQFQDEGMVAGLNQVSDKLIAMGVGEQTHEPVDNLEIVTPLKVGQKVFLKSDGPEFTGEIFEFQDAGMVAGLRSLSAKLSGLGCGYKLPTQQHWMSMHSIALEGMANPGRHADHACLLRREETHEPVENLAPAE